ncbi:MAG: SufS family cysteine desulfurase [Parolsenella sp.]|uniref:aminotransferase class V-fold PLP-dependent enzyme n=1 Tax=Parolsenella sp. TaxID=2083006 RepID=UPI002E7A826B|nr:SufS family cysteine desulfurase [Parolsenella sp.]MEE1372098.1 SufS family cysteine desulfurase [Parolsenella sp.]
MANMTDIQASPFKADFPLLANNPELVFLDSAATAQRPAAVLDAERSFYETMNANPLRGLYKLSVDATAAIDQARAKIAAFVGADDPAEVIFTRNASESLNLIAKTLGPTVLHEGDEVCISIMEHHSNLIPWQQVCRVSGAKLVFLRPDDQGVIGPEEIAAKIGPKTKIVSVTHVSNVLGVENPIRAIADAGHAQGAIVIADGAQSLPHVLVDVKELGVDAFTFSAHKLGGPMGIGGLWAHRKLLESLPPFLTGGEMIDSVTEDGAVWAPIPEKFEAGTQDAAGIYATGVAIDYILEHGRTELEERERELAAYLCEKLQALPYVKIVGPDDPRAHIGAVSFMVDAIHPHDVSSLLDTKNIAIRAGHHCAQPLLTWMGIESCCRASVGFYNDKTDVDRLVEGLDFVWGVFNG